jgi:6-phosphofructokinase 2
VIATLTLNPAIDKSIEVEQLIPEKKMRCPKMMIEAGGGGINISKAIEELGGQSIAIFPFGGVNGKSLIKLLSQRNIIVKPIEIKDDTRESIVITELSTNKQYRFVMPGPQLSEAETKQIREAVENLENVSYLVVSGSLPLNIPDAFLSEIADIASAKKIKLVVDTSGKPLISALKKGVYLIKPNLTELCFLSGKKHLEPGEIDHAVYDILKNGLCEVIVVSMGSAGALLTTKRIRKRCPAPMVRKLSTVGAGDSMIAGILYMLEQNKSLEEAVQFGVACGSAATINKGSQLFKRNDAFKFYDWILNEGKNYRYGIPNSDSIQTIR